MARQRKGTNPSQVDGSERPYFIEAIRAAGESDDGPTLIYADFLEEQGESERADFIRLQIEAARGRGDSSERRHAIQRAIRGLLDTHAAVWRERELPLIPGLSWNHYERGLVRTITVNRLQILAEHADTILNAAPVEGVLLRNPPFNSLVPDSQLNRVDDKELDWIDHPVWDRFQRFDFKGCELKGRMGALVERARWPRARSLNLSGCRLENGDLRGMAFGRWEPLTRVTKLNLNRNGFSDEGVIALAESLACGAEELPLETLMVAGSRESVWHEIENPEEPPRSLIQSIRARFSAARQRRVTTGRFISEARGGLSPEVIPALVKLAKAAPGLRKLDLSDHPGLVEPSAIEPLEQLGVQVTIGIFRD